MNWHECSRKSDKKKKWAEFWKYCRGKFAFYILVNKLMMRTNKCSRKKNFFRFSWCAWRREEMWIKFGNVHKRSDDIVFFIRLAYWPKVKHVTRGQNKGKKKLISVQLWMRFFRSLTRKPVWSPVYFFQTPVWALKENLIRIAFLCFLQLFNHYGKIFPNGRRVEDKVR